jgi:hypothetical protein
MHGAIPPLLQYSFMAWCSVKKKARGQLYLYLTTAPKTMSRYSRTGGVSLYSVLIEGLIVVYVTK